MSDNFGLGFKTISVKYNDDSTVLRWLFVKQHFSREKVPEKPSDKTLFVLNVPPFCDENSLRHTFECFGEVKEVFCHLKPTAQPPPQESSNSFSVVPKLQTYKVAYVVFESHVGLNKVLTRDPEEPLILSSTEFPIKSGLEKWFCEYNNKILNTKELQNEIDSFMAKFDEEEQKKEHAAKMLGEEDAEGWTTVTRKSKKLRIARTETARKKILEKERDKRSRRELKNFYTFQIRESKMKHLENLRKKFEEDKRKIIAFKQTRKFKPF